MSVYDTAAASTSVSPAIVDEFLRGRADLHKPTYRELSAEGLSNRAIETLHLGRDMFALDYVPYEFAKWLYETQSMFPLAAREVPPMKREPFVERPAPAIADEWDALTLRVRSEWESLEVSAYNERRDGFYRANRGAWS